MVACNKDHLDQEKCEVRHYFPSVIRLDKDRIYHQVLVQLVVVLIDQIIVKFINIVGDPPDIENIYLNI